MPPPHEAVEFLTALWGPVMPAGLYAQVWAKKGAKTRSTYLQHWQGVPAVITTNRAADVYVGCAAIAKKLAASVRGKAKDAAAIPGFWLDVDVGAGHAPDLDAAVAVTKLIELPTILVASGGGVHAWWLFDEPWVFTDDDDRAEAAAAAAGWVEAHRQRAPFKLDSVGELARVLRLPGTVNHKGGAERPVQLLGSSDVRFPRSTLTGHARAHRARPAAADDDEGGGSGWAEVSAVDVPWDLLSKLRANNDVFDRTWTMSRRDVKAQGWSASDWDASIASQLVASGLGDQDVIALTMQFRREHGDEKGKLGRPDYWARTLRLAKRSDSGDAKREEAELVAELIELRETPAAAVSATTPDRWAKLNQLTGGGVGPSPRIVEWHQHGTDPERAKHIWILSDGREVEIGTIYKVLDQRTVKGALMVVAGIMRPGTWKTQTWELGIHTVLPLRVIHTDPEAERDQRALEWVAQVINERSIESDAEHLNDAILFRRPFIRDGRVYVRQSYLGQQLRVQRIAPDVRDSDLPPWLRSAGFERVAVHFDKAEGSRGSRSYWVIDEELLP